MKKHLLILLLFLSGCIFVDTSPQRCYHLWDSSQKDKCLLMVAAETLNISKCDEIGKAELAEQCYNSLFGKGVSENASTCEKLSGLSLEDCFARLASRNNDTSFCLRIALGDKRDNCISRIAVGMERPDLCEAISSNISRDNCKNQIYPQLAMENENPDFCRQLVANNTEAQSVMVDNCLFSMAKQLNDTSYCSQITNSFSKELCLTGKIDPSSCAQIADARGQQACIYISAVYSKDPNQCKTLPSSMMGTCYMQIAKDTDNPQICYNIPAGILRDQCLQVSPT